MVRADEIPDTQAPSTWLEVEEGRYQDGTTPKMAFGVAELVTDCSRRIGLPPRGIIVTGTPPGVGMGRDAKGFLKRGEVMRLGIQNLSARTRKVVARA